MRMGSVGVANGTRDSVPTIAIVQLPHGWVLSREFFRSFGAGVGMISCFPK
jgi:hypothetical protein